MPFSGNEPDEIYQERNRWLVEALRSGQYVQGRQTLQINFSDGTTRHCCLGVACRVAMAHGLPLLVNTITVLDMDKTKTRFVNGNNRDDTGMDLPPEVVRDWFGWVDTDPHLRDSNGTLAPASSRNDNLETFNQIADAFEYTYNLASTMDTD